MVRVDRNAQESERSVMHTWRSLEEEQPRFRRVPEAMRILTVGAWAAQNSIVNAVEVG